MKTDSDPNTPTKPNWFAELWAVESAKFKDSMAKSGIIVTPVEDFRGQAEMEGTTLSFVPAPKKRSKPQITDPKLTRAAQKR